MLIQTKYIVRLELHKDTNNLKHHFQDAIVKHVPRLIHVAKDFHARSTSARKHAQLHVDTTRQGPHTTVNGVNTVNMVNGTVNIGDFNTKDSAELKSLN